MADEAIRELTCSLIREARAAKGWSKTEVARRSGVDRGLVSRIEDGIAQGSVATIVAIASALEIDLNLLKLDHDTPHPVGSPIDPAEPTRLPEDMPIEPLSGAA